MRVRACSALCLDQWTRRQTSRWRDALSFVAERPFDAYVEGKSGHGFSVDETYERVSGISIPSPFWLGRWREASRSISNNEDGFYCTGSLVSWLSWMLCRLSVNVMFFARETVGVHGLYQIFCSNQYRGWWLLGNSEHSTETYLITR